MIFRKRWSKYSFKIALGIYGSFLIRKNEKPICNIPITYMKYPELFEAHAWISECKCIESCRYIKEYPKNLSNYNITIYESFLNRY